MVFVRSGSCTDVRRWSKLSLIRIDRPSSAEEPIPAADILRDQRPHRPKSARHASGGFRGGPAFRVITAWLRRAAESGRRTLPDDDRSATRGRIPSDASRRYQIAALLGEARRETCAPGALVRNHLTRIGGSFETLGLHRQCTDTVTCSSPTRREAMDCERRARDARLALLRLR